MNVELVVVDDDLSVRELWLPFESISLELVRLVMDTMKTAREEISRTYYGDKNRYLSGGKECLIYPPPVAVCTGPLLSEWCHAPCIRCCLTYML